jgi:hypothetical protein
LFHPWEKQAVPVLNLSAFCDNRACSFALWKENKFFTAKKKSLTKAVATELLKNGKVKLIGSYSEKTGKTYDSVVLLDDTGGKYVNFTMEFGGGEIGHGKTGIIILKGVCFAHNIFISLIGKVIYLLYWNF